MTNIPMPKTIRRISFCFTGTRTFIRRGMAMMSMKTSAEMDMQPWMIS